MRYGRVLLLFPDYKGGHFGALRPPAGLGYLAETLKAKGIDYKLVDMAVGASVDDLKSAMQSFKPDLVGISLMSFMYKRSYEIAKIVKDIDPNVHIVAGGPHVSTVRETVLKECPAMDFGAVLEAEELIIELCTGVELSRIMGLIRRDGGEIIYNGDRPFKDNLDEFPFPRYEGFPMDKYVTEEIGIATSRGCPHSCIYCPVKAAIGRKWRRRSAESIVEEIDYWYKRGVRQISILDDNFTLLRPRVEQICREIISRGFKGLELNCNNGIRADRVDYALLKLMREAGFKYLAFGVEAGNNKVLAAIKKGETIEVVEEALRHALDLGYKVTLFFIIGSPGETIADVQDSIDFALKHPVFDARFYNLVPFPRSELYEWVRDNNYFTLDPEEYLNSSSQWDYKAVFQTPEMNSDQRAEALRMVRDVRKRIRYNSMKRTLKGKLGPLAGPAARVYINDWVQDRLMKSKVLRRNLKRLFMKVAG